MKKYLGIAIALIFCLSLMTACKGGKDNNSSHNGANSNITNGSSEHSTNLGDDISNGLNDLSDGIHDLGSDIKEGIDDMLPNSGDDSADHNSSERNSNDSSR